jgi:hypothetical protein
VLLHFWDYEVLLQVGWFFGLLGYEGTKYSQASNSRRSPSAVNLLIARYKYKQRLWWRAAVLTLLGEKPAAGPQTFEVTSFSKRIFCLSKSVVFPQDPPDILSDGATQAESGRS